MSPNEWSNRMLLPILFILFIRSNIEYATDVLASRRTLPGPLIGPAVSQ
jgi:hypothetical protein